VTERGGEGGGRGAFKNNNENSYNLCFLKRK
jgi:hypothetical protein